MLGMNMSGFDITLEFLHYTPFTRKFKKCGDKERPGLRPGPAKGREVFGNHDLEFYDVPEGSESLQSGEAATFFRVFDRTGYKANTVKQTP
ncbi:hypothetical protein CCP2SC5_180029 [Azospirillaceae bacterium]